MEIKSFKAYNFGNDTVNGENRAGGVYRFYDMEENVIQTGDITFINTCSSSGSCEQDINIGLVTNEGGCNAGPSYTYNTVYAFRTDKGLTCTNNNFSSNLYSSAPNSNASIKLDFYEPQNVSKIEVNLISTSANGDCINSRSCDIDLERTDGTIITLHILHNDYSNRNEILTFEFEKDGEYDQRIHKFKTNTISKIVTNLNKIENISSISKLKIECIEDNVETFVRFAISIDDKSTWKVFKSNSWSDISENDVINNGNTKDELESLNLSNFSNLFTDGLQHNLDVLVTMKTTNEDISPEISKITVIGIE